MAVTQIERLAVVEIKVENIEEKIDVLNTNVKDMHDCLDNTRDDIMEVLTTISTTSCSQHAELANQIKTLQDVRRKYTTYAIAFLAFAAGTGWIGTSPNLAVILKFIGV